MSEITYPSVEALLRDAVEGEGALRCTFRCPVTEADVEAKGALVKGRELDDVVPGDSSLLGGLRNALSGLLSAALGSEESKSPVRLAEGEAPSEFSESERKAAIVVAFKSVADRFVWDANGSRWVSIEGAGELLTDFDRMLRAAPITAERDREVAARMLVEVARADGQVTPAEWSFLASFIPADLSSVDTCMEMSALSAEELASVGPDARETMVMLAWALAHVDHDLDAKEEGQLLTYAERLAVARARALELRDYARTFLLEAALQRAYDKGRVDATRLEEARQLGTQLGLDSASLAKAEASFKRRHGVA